MTDTTELSKGLRKILHKHHAGNELLLQDLNAYVDPLMEKARREERELCAQVADNYREQVQVPCPDGKPGCLVLHTREHKPVVATLIAAAIRQQPDTMTSRKDSEHA